MDLVQLETLRSWHNGDTTTTIRKAHLSGSLTDSTQQQTTTTETLAVADTTTTRSESLPQPKVRHRLGFFARWGIISFVVVVLAILNFGVRIFLKAKP